MTVNELLSMEKSGSLFKVVNADKPGYMRDDAPWIFWGSKQMVKRDFGECKLEAFGPASKRDIVLYVYLRKEGQDGCTDSEN